MTMTASRTELLAMQVEHAAGRRPVQVGDVFTDPSAPSTPPATVVEVLAEERSMLDPINRGTAVLERELDGRKRYTHRRLETMSALHLVRVGARVETDQAFQHRTGNRTPAVGDVFAESRDLDREALVVEVIDGRVRLSWISTGRSSWRSLESLRWMSLVRWAE